METLENKTNQNAALTKERQAVTLSSADAAEYRAYKRQKKMAEITMALARSSSFIGVQDDALRIAEKAARLRQASVRVSPVQLREKRDVFAKCGVRVDCWIGGNGELLPKVKTYEMKIARQMGAREFTVRVAPSLILNCRYAEIKRELRKLKRICKKSCLKVWVDKNYAYATVLKMARICSEIGVQYFCVPYFIGCERLRFDLTGGCELEISEVESLADFKKMRGAGVGRIVTSHAWEIYSEWMRELDVIGTPVKDTGTDATPQKEEKNVVATPVKEEKTTPAPIQTSVLESKKEEKPKAVTAISNQNPETNYCCRLEGNELKFL